MGKKAKLFISTGTPTDEIKKILKSKNIDHYFSEHMVRPQKNMST